MKKLIAILLALVCVFALCACGSSSTPAASEPAKEVLVMGTSADYAPFEFMYPNDKGELVAVSHAKDVVENTGYDRRGIIAAAGALLLTSLAGIYIVAKKCFGREDSNI